MVGTAYVEQYDAALKRIEDAGYQIKEEFRIANRFRDTTDGSVERALLLTKVDTVLGYFDLVKQAEDAGRPVIGFRGPRKA